MGQTWPLFVYFLFLSHDKYSTNLTLNDKSIDNMLGTRTQGGSMVGTDKSTELWRHPHALIKFLDKKIGSRNNTSRITQPFIPILPR